MILEYTFIHGTFVAGTSVGLRETLRLLIEKISLAIPIFKVPSVLFIRRRVRENRA